MGILLAHLLQKKHPAKNLKKSKKSEGNWLKCVENSEWDLTEIDSIRIKTLIESSLSYSFEKRPSIDEFIETLHMELNETYRLDSVLSDLRMQNREYEKVDPNEHLAWASSQTFSISNKKKIRLYKNC